MFTLCFRFYIMTDSDTDSIDETFNEKLQRKIADVRKWYKDEVLLQSVNFDIRVVSSMEQHLFSSMKRWHKNSHISDSTWLEKFQKIVPLLNLEGKMQLSPVVNLFLHQKSKAENLKSRLKIPDFLDAIIPSIREAYQSLINEREDEFSFRFAKLTGREIWFLNSFFQPAAMFFTYKSLHPETSEKDLCDDLFTIGMYFLIIELVDNIF